MTKYVFSYSVPAGFVPGGGVEVGPVMGVPAS